MKDRERKQRDAWVGRIWSWCVGAGALALVLCVWFSTRRIVDWFDDTIGSSAAASAVSNGVERRGQVGDAFGAVNALFSGLAFAGVLIALRLQRIEMTRQAEAERAARARAEEEMAAQKDAHEATLRQNHERHVAEIQDRRRERLAMAYAGWASAFRAASHMLRDGLGGRHMGSPHDALGEVDSVYAASVAIRIDEDLSNGEVVRGITEELVQFSRGAPVSGGMQGLLRTAQALVDRRIQEGMKVDVRSGS